MVPRRITRVLGLCALLAAVGAGCVAWSSDLPTATALVSRGLSESYGVSLSANGATTVSLLPLPRLGFRDVRLTAGGADGPVLVEGGTLSVQLSLTALLSGRADAVSLALDHARIVLPERDDDARWTGPAARLAERFAAGDIAHPRRITLSGATILGRDPRDGRPEQARDVDVVVSWPLWSETLHVSGALTWRESTARFALSGLRPGDLTGGRTSAFAMSASWATGSLNAQGEASVRDGVRVSGQASLRTVSLADTLGWIGADLALSPLIEDLALEGRFEASREGLHLPSLRASSGATLLEGAGSAELNGWRPSLRATLATDTLNLGPLLAGLLRIAGPDDPESTGAWGRHTLSLGPLLGGDLDLRLSASNARLGPVILTDIASSVIVREGGIDASLGRAGLQGGTLKGRVVLSQAKDRPDDDTEVRAQGAFEGLDLAALLIDLGQYGWMLGATQGSFALEGRGRDADSLVRRVSGKASLAVEGGAIAGLDLTDVIHRGGAVAPGALARRNGRTPFERAAIVLAFSDGVGLITEGGLTARALTASLRGRLSLPERLFQARAGLLPRLAAAGSDPTGAPATLFEISGPWDAVAVKAASPRSDAGGDPLQLPAVDRGLPTPARSFVP